MSMTGTIRVAPLLTHVATTAGRTTRKVVKTGYIKPTLAVAPFVGGLFGLVSLKNGYEWSREKGRGIPRSVVHGIINGACGGLCAYGITWIAIPVVVSGGTLWAIGDAEIVTTTEDDTTTTTEVENAPGFTIKSTTRKTKQQGETKWDDATVREELIDDGALTDPSQAYKEEA